MATRETETVARTNATVAKQRADNGAGVADSDRGLDVALYRKMLLIRRFEEAVQSLFLKGEIYGTTHLYNGQEASAVGVTSVLADGDRVAATYRGHGAALALGTEPQALMDELCGRSTGVCGGRAGSMNIVDLEHGLVGSFGIVGGSIGAATGVALAFKQRRLENVAVAFFGDGATNQGYFFECLNFAKVHGLPLVFVCENNLYMEFTPIETVTAGEILARPRAMEVPAASVDGNDVWAVREAAAEAVAHARSGEGPYFLETRTYRLVGHSRSDPGRYRKPGELDEWQQREPLVVARQRMAERHGIDDEGFQDIEADVADEMEQVVQQALAAPWPSPEAPADEFKTPDQPSAPTSEAAR
jgi:TPP-dependent pyruvate/acetoin dehydrogenase alpha subunit